MIRQSGPSQKASPSWLLWGAMGIVAGITIANLPTPDPSLADTGLIPLSNFSKYPQGWEARGGWEKAGDLYEVVPNEEGAFLRAKDSVESARLFKKTPWDSSAFPVVEWKWRVKKWPPSGSGRVTIYIALDRDIFGIPTIVKYHWSRNEPEGEVQEGGFFRPSDRVVQNGISDADDWITERVDALADFRKISGRDPRSQAYGIGILVDPGIVAEIGEISARSH